MQGVLWKMGKLGKSEADRRWTGELLQGAENFVPLRIEMERVARNRGTNSRCIARTLGYAHQSFAVPGMM
jgi:hypothetical protein